MLMISKENVLEGLGRFCADSLGDNPIRQGRLRRDGMRPINCILTRFIIILEVYSSFTLRTSHIAKPPANPAERGMPVKKLKVLKRNRVNRTLESIFELPLAIVESPIG